MSTSKRHAREANPGPHDHESPVICVSPPSQDCIVVMCSYSYDELIMVVGSENDLNTNMPRCIFYRVNLVGLEWIWLGVEWILLDIEWILLDIEWILLGIEWILLGVKAHLCYVTRRIIIFIGEGVATVPIGHIWHMKQQIYNRLMVDKTDPIQSPTPDNCQRFSFFAAVNCKVYK